MSDATITHEFKEMYVDERGHDFLWRESRVIRCSITRILRNSSSDHVDVVNVDSGSCGNCGEYVGVEYVDEENVRSKTECTLPDGITTVVEIDVPSGKVVINDSLRDVYDAEDDGLNYNSKLGQHIYVERMAELGCAYGPVLNTSPGFYETGEGSYVIARAAMNWETDEEIIPEGWVERASVCTDLWAYSIADYDDYVSKGGQIEREYGSPEVVEIPAGRYRLTHHTGEKDFDFDAEGEIIFGHFERIGDCS